MINLLADAYGKSDDCDSRRNMVPDLGNYIAQYEGCPSIGVVTFDRFKNLLSMSAKWMICDANIMGIDNCSKTFVP